MNWSDIMDAAIATIAGALIGVAGTILINFLGNRKGYKEINSKIGSLDNTTLSGEHQQMKKEIILSLDEKEKDIQNKIGILNNTTLSGQNIEIQKSIEELNAQLRRKEQREAFRKQSLTNDMNNIDSSIEALTAFSQIMKELQSEKIILQQRLYESTKKCQKLEAENAELKKRLHSQTERKNEIKTKR